MSVQEKIKELYLACIEAERNGEGDYSSLKRELEIWLVAKTLGRKGDGRYG